jgi:hypothetical protein
MAQAPQARPMVAEVKEPGTAHDGPAPNESAKTFGFPTGSLSVRCLRLVARVYAWSVIRSHDARWVNLDGGQMPPSPWSMAESI